MPEYLHPGVYIQEVSFRGKPIEGVSTSTVGFVGRALKGPEGKPTLVTSFTEFVRTFGPAISNPSSLGDYLGHAVQGFFANQGLRAYIVRVLGNGAQAASTAFSTPQLGNGVVMKLTSTVRVPTTTVPVAVLLPVNTLRTVQSGLLLSIYRRTDPSSSWTFLQNVAVSGYDPLRSTVTVAAGVLPPGLTLDPGNTYLYPVTVAPTTSSGITPSFVAQSRGQAGNNLAVQITPQDLSPVRMSTASFVRAPVTLANFTGTGPNGTTTAFTSIPLGPTAMKQVRSGDTIQFSTATSGITVGTIAAASVQVTAPSTGTLGPYTVAATVSLTRRGPSAVSPAFSFGAIGSAVDLTGPLPKTVNLPHAIAATLQSGDVISFSEGANNATVTIGTITLATSIGVPSNTGNFSTSQLTLTASPGRLFVNGLSGLGVPNDNPLDSLNVTSGRSGANTTAELVDPALGVIFYGGGTGTTFPSAQVTDANWQSVEDLVVVPQNGQTIPVATTAPFYTGAVVLVDDGVNAPTETIVTAVSPTARTITVSSPITAGVTVDADPTLRAAFVRTLEFSVQVLDSGTVVENFANLSWNSAATSEAYRKFYINAINDPNAGSAYVTINPPSSPPLTPSRANLPTTLDGFPLLLGGGGDGAAPSNIEIIGQDNGPGNRTGIQALKEPDDIALIACPGVTDVAVQDELIAQCELLKYRFAVLDGKPDQSDVSAILAHRNNYDSEYAAYYEPWLQTLDLTTGNTILVPPSGHVLGIYARSDNTRGVHKAPANEVVNTIEGIEFNFTNGEQDVLNPAGVNLVRNFEASGRGLRVWGARTISSDQDWKYINVRRLFIYLEHSIDNGTQWVVFEPNNESLWARVVDTITAFLVGVWKTGALMGTKPEDAFFVRCDRTTMTQDDIDNGRLVCLIGVAPTFPAEFVIFKIGQFTASASQS
jgi:phage tail sheath protein FI